MEDVNKFVRKISKGLIFGSSSSSLTESPYNVTGGGDGGVGLSAALSSDQPRVYFNRASKQVVSLWTCSKICTFFFVAGIFVGYTLKKRVRRWASKILKKLKDD